MNRQDLLDKLTLVSPALSANVMVPVLQSFWFTGTHVMASNDAIAISTPLETDFQGAAPKHMLDLLKASQADEIDITFDKDNLLMRAASSKFRLGLLPPESFVFTMPEPKDDAPFQLAKLDGFFAAIDTCMRSVSTDGSIPDQLGITVIPNGQWVNLYSTNNATISTALVKASTKMKDRVVLSEAFCKQMLDLKGDKLRLEINKDYALFTADDTTLFGRLIETAKPIDFVKAIEHHTPKGYQDNLVKIPKTLEGMLERAIIVTDVTNAYKQPTVISVKARGEMVFSSKTERGEVVDKVKIDDNQPEVTARVEAKLIKQGYGSFDRMLVTKDAVLMTKADGSALYMIGVSGE